MCLLVPTQDSGISNVNSASYLNSVGTKFSNSLFYRLSIFINTSIDYYEQYFYILFIYIFIIFLLSPPSY